MPRTIEERLQEVISNVEDREGKGQSSSLSLLQHLLADFKAEGIAHRIIVENKLSQAS